jgi:hypothetical protein
MPFPRSGFDPLGSLGDDGAAASGFRISPSCGLIFGRTLLLGLQDTMHRSLADPELLGDPAHAQALSG